MSLLDILQNIGTSREDSVGIWDASWQQVFIDARPLNCSVSEPSKNMEHPLETGAVITDHRIILPIEVTMNFVIMGAQYQSVYKEIKQAYLLGTLFYIYTRAQSYANMMMIDLPHEETPDDLDTLKITIGFKQVEFVTAFFEPLPARKVKEKTNASTKEKGQVKSSETPAAVQNDVKSNGLLKQGKDWLTGIL